jgi:hypothetical protein
MKKKSKNLSKNCDCNDCNQSDLELKVAELERICKAFSFILPAPAKTHADCVTTTELYRVQHRLAKDMWIQYINSKQ